MEIDSEELTKLIQVANLFESKVRTYSGRNMYGKECLGIDCNYGSEIELIEEAASQGIRGAKIDTMGKGMIVYWPDLEKNEWLDLETGEEIFPEDEEEDSEEEMSSR